MLLAPAPHTPLSPTEWANRARLMLDTCQLQDWGFSFDRAIRRLGSCQPAKKKITLSLHFVQHAPNEIIERTLRHEIAHALCWLHHKISGHGAQWRHYCTQLGIEGERATVKIQLPESKPRPVRFLLVHRDTGEVYRKYYARPRAKDLSRCYIPGKKEHTLGKLAFVPATGASG